MKKLILFLLFNVCFCFTGCISTNVSKDFYIDVQEYLDLNGVKCLEYIEADNNISKRDKEKYKVRHRYIQSQLNIKMQE